MTVVNTAIPVLSGVFRQGRTVSASNGTWTFDLNYLTYTYQWLRCDSNGANCVPILGQTQSSYVIQAADVRSTLECTVSATEHTNPSPPAGDPYTSVDFAAGLYSGEGVVTVFEAYQTDARLSNWGGLPSDYYDNPGAFGYSPGTSMTTDSNQRMHLFSPASLGLPPNPSGSGYASWQELRTTDGQWESGGSGLAKSTLNVSQSATFGAGGFSFGAIRWFAWDILFPLNINSVSFQLPATDFLVLGYIHDSGGTGAAPAGLEIYPTGGSYPANVMFTTTPNENAGGVPYIRVPLLQLWDSGGSRVTANFNTWHEFVIGEKFTADGTGWFEVWCDGVQKAAQTSRQLLQPSEGGPYAQLQNYTRWPTSYVGGATRSAVVYGGFRAGLARTDVQTM